MRKAFTLIELLISIIILSILMLFLYQSYAQLNKSNGLLNTKVQQSQKEELIKKTLYLDIITAIKGSIQILKQDPKKDIIFLQSTHSLHERINPYVAYILKEKHLYRLESFKAFKEYPLPAESNFVVDDLGAVDIFRLYPSKNKKSPSYFVHLKFVNKNEIILKIKPLS